jgi:hypothetical protein
MCVCLCVCMCVRVCVCMCMCVCMCLYHGKLAPEADEYPVVVHVLEPAYAQAVTQRFAAGGSLARWWCWMLMMMMRFV